MLKLGSVPLLAAVLLAIGACNSDQNQNPTGPVDDASLLDEVSKMGFSARDAVDMGDRFLVEGDIVLLKADLKARLSPSVPMATKPRQVPPPSKQWSATWTASWVANADYTINLDALAGQDDWLAAAQEAVQHWNNDITSRVHFDILSGYSANLTFSTYTQWCYQSPCTLALGEYPQQIGNYNEASIGHHIQVNLGFRVGLGAGGKPTYAAKVNTLVHEIGHTLGFRHTNWQQLGDSENPVGAHQIAGTPPSDYYSVMNGGTANRDWEGFSYYDRTAIRTLFPGGPRTPTGNIDESGHPVLSWPSYTDAVSYRVALQYYASQFDEYGNEWQVSGGWDIGTTSGNSLVDYNRTANGPISCPGMSAGYNYGYTVVITYADGTTGGYAQYLPAGLACFDFTGGLPEP